MLSFEIYALGDRGLTISFGNTVNETVNDACIAFAQYLEELSLSGVRDIVPAYTTVSVYYDPLVIRQLPGVQNAQKALTSKLSALLKEWKPGTAANPKRKMIIPVCYDVSLAPDLNEFAQEKNLSVDEVIRLHTAKTYRVYMLGFLPGFPYMGTVDEKLTAKRKTTPHLKLPAGSVGIAGVQTGIYPLESPGGWNIIGQTPVKMFDANSDSLTCLQPGDEVQFTSISKEEFHQLKYAI